MICTNCGNNVKKSDKFCTKCGYEINMSEKKGKTGICITVGIFVVLVALAAAFFAGRNMSVLETDDEYGIEEHDSKADMTVSSKDDEAESGEAMRKEYKEENGTDENTMAGEAGEDNSEADAALWMKAYSDFLKTDKESETEYQNIGYGLIYVNDDDIPEVLMYGDCEATGNRFLTWSEKNGVDMVQFGRLGYTLQEKDNILINSDGNMGYYYDIVYSIDDNGKWERVASGNSGIEYQDEAAGDYTETGRYYNWNDKAVSLEEYNRELSKYYDRTSAAYIRSYDDSDTESYDENGDYIISIGDLYEYDEIIEMLDEGKPVMSKLTEVCIKDSRDIHRYEIFVEDVSWYEARNKCRDMGGYLVRINSSDEYDYLSNMINEQGYDKNVFWLSGNRDYITERSPYHWVANDYRSEVADLNTDPELSKYWMNGEPSYTGENAEGDIVEEDCMVMFFNKKEDRFVFNDVQDEITQYYKGKIAYICEYEQDAKE